MVTARRTALDPLRRERLRVAKEREAVERMEPERPDPPPESVVRDAGRRS